MKKIRCLLTAVINNAYLAGLTRECYNSIESKEHLLDVMVDTRKQKNGLSQAWNEFFDFYRDGDYDYLVWASNDTQLDKNYIDYIIRYFEEDAPDNVGIVSATQTADLAQFLIDRCTIPYSTQLSNNMYTSVLVFKKGVIEAVGEVDEQFPLEYGDRDYLYRAELAGYKSVSLAMPLIYHPHGSQTIGNPSGRLEDASKKYVAKWGGDALSEVFKTPYGN